SLRSDLQGGVPPFRSSYDTASYLATLRAVEYQPTNDGDYVKSGPHKNPDGTSGEPFNGLSVNLAKNLAQPERSLPVHIYEVGHSGAYPMTLDDPLGPRNPRVRDWCKLLRYLLCILAGTFFAACLVYPVSKPWRDFVHWLPGVVRSSIRRRRAGSDRSDP